MSIRSEIVYARTYSRPLEDGARESWSQTVERVIDHQQWLWERAQNHPLNEFQQDELTELYDLFLSKKALPAGRTLWLGGTDLSRRRESTQFNCAFLRIETVHDMVDAFWLLLQGCGVGFEPVPGTLSGFANHMDVEIIRSQRPAEYRGRGINLETLEEGVWTISIGDSGEAWAKAIGKLLAGKKHADKLVIDLSEIRGAGGRMSQYGWISAGDEALAQGLQAICTLLNNRVDTLLNWTDIIDIANWLGFMQTGRRGAQIALFRFGDDWENFANLKQGEYWVGNPQRAQSNNSLVFYERPEIDTIEEILTTMFDAGGSEPGLINGQTARTRAPWFKGVNPCSEILLGNKSFCNLMEVDISQFKDMWELEQAMYLVGRANYRQTCVNLRDGVLQSAWHENNEFLRLCGVGLTGIVRALDRFYPYDFKKLRIAATEGARSMARELGLPMPKLVTTIKPSGTVSKVMNTTEGIHKPLGRYIFNNIVFNKHDPLVELLEKANYEVMKHPIESSAVIVKFPVSWPDVDFAFLDGKYVNDDTAIEQLERYKLLMNNYVDHNCSITVSYSEDELRDIARWIYYNWDYYVGVSFILRADPTKTAKDLGYSYLPQEVVEENVWQEYVQGLKSFTLDTIYTPSQIEAGECETGVCPVR